MAILTGQGPMGFAFPTSEVRTSGAADWTSGTPPCGQRGRDAQGNEYILVKMAEINYYGGIVVFNTSFVARRCDAVTDAGPVGVCMRTVAVDDYAWVMVYGVHPAVQIDDSAADSTFGLIVVNAATSVPHVMVAAAGAADSSPTINPIHGMRLMSAADSAATIASGAVVSDAVSSAYSGTFGRMMLNYPWATGITMGEGVTAT